MTERRLIDRAATAKLAKLIRLLATGKAGERLAAVEAIGRSLSAAGLDFNDFGDVIEAIGAPPIQQQLEPSSWREMVRYCQDCGRSLKPRERQFIAGMARWHGDPSKKQIDWLCSIYDAVLEQAA